jgi:hypothetical protein
LREQRWSYPAAAEKIGVHPIHFACAVTGRVRPCRAIRKRLPLLLGVPLEDLFNPDRIDKPFLGDLGIGTPAADPLCWDVPDFPPLGGAE